MRRTLASLFCAAAVATLLGAAPLHAQTGSAPQAPAAQAPAAPPRATPRKHVPDPIEVPDEAIQPEDIAPLRQHYRPTLHPGDPLHLVGNEQDGNDLRAQTPLLVRGQHVPLQVDTEASYQRALSMYGDDTLYHVPLPPASQTEPAPATKGPRMPAPVAEPKESGPAATPWSVLAGVCVSVLLLVWFFVRVRPSLVAPSDMLAHRPSIPAAEDFVFRPTRRAPAPFRPTLEHPPAVLPQRPAGTAADARATKQQPRR